MLTRPGHALIAATLLLITGCDLFTDAATRLAHDIASTSKKLKQDGDRITLHHNVPS